MTKREMVNRMVVLGIITEKDINHVMRKSAERVLSIYVSAVPKRLAYLGRA